MNFVDGEIYADIAKDPEHPFVINSGDVSVDVLGTTFNMKSFSDAECVEVILLEGSVRFNVLEDTHRNEMVMRPGNMLQYHRSSGKIDLDVFPKDKYSAFYKNRSLHFFNITNSINIKMIERQTPLIIFLHNCKCWAGHNSICPTQGFNNTARNF